MPILRGLALPFGCHDPKEMRYEDPVSSSYLIFVRHATPICVCLVMKEAAKPRVAEGWCSKLGQSA